MDNETTSDTEPKSKPKRKARFRRILIAAGLLVVIAVGLYGASVYNASRYFLVTEVGHVRVARGRMLPFGRETFVPRDPKLRKAYKTITLPAGMPAPKGARPFSDRVELDQAIYQVLRDAADYSLTKDDARTPELLSRYLEQLEALPGLNAQQQLSLLTLKREAGYIEARGLTERARAMLTSAQLKFQEASKGGTGRYPDAAIKAAAIRRALLALDELGAAPATQVSGTSKSSAPPPVSSSKPPVSSKAPAKGNTPDGSSDVAPDATPATDNPIDSVPPGKSSATTAQPGTVDAPDARKTPNPATPPGLTETSTTG